MIIFYANVTKLKKREIFGKADLIAYTLISVDSDGVSCDLIIRVDNSSIFGTRMELVVILMILLLEMII